eukprot:5698699-Prymnesium_polylepis.1
MAERLEVLVDARDHVVPRDWNAHCRARDPDSQGSVVERLCISCCSSYVRFTGGSVRCTAARPIWVCAE